MTKLIMTVAINQSKELDINFDIEQNDLSHKDEIITVNFVKEQMVKVLTAAMKKGMEK